MTKQREKEHKQFTPFQLKVDNEKGIVEEIVAVMGNIDEGGDIIHPGAFAKTIQERAAKIKVLDQHNTDSIMRILGKPVSMRELSRGELPQQLLAEYPSANGALAVTTQYFLDTPEGKGAFVRVKEGTVEYSIGYDAQDIDFSKAKGEDGKEITVRNLRTIKLYEYGPVLWGMNPATMTVSAKSVTPYHSMPLESREKAWDASAAEKRVRDWAGGEDNTNWTKYRRAFFWYDSDNEETFGAYKLGYADVVDGELVAVPRGIFAVAAALQGARQEIAIPDADKTAIKRQVSRWYKKMAAEFDDEDLSAPWDKASGVDPDEKSVNITELLRQIELDFMSQFNMGDGPADFFVREVFDDHLIACHWRRDSGKDEYFAVPFSVDEGVANFAPKEQWTQGDYVFVPSSNGGLSAGLPTAGMSADNEATEAKTGRVLSRRNAEALRSAVDNIVGILKGAGVWADDEEDEDGKAKSGAKDNEPANDAPNGAARQDGSETDSTNDAAAGPPNQAPTKEALLIELETLGIDLHKIQAEV